MVAGWGPVVAMTNCIPYLIGPFIGGPIGAFFADRILLLRWIERAISNKLEIDYALLLLFKTMYLTHSFSSWLGDVGYTEAFVICFIGDALLLLFCSCCPRDFWLLAVLEVQLMSWWKVSWTENWNTQRLFNILECRYDVNTNMYRQLQANAELQHTIGVVINMANSCQFTALENAFVNCNKNVLMSFYGIWEWRIWCKIESLFDQQ
jgi:hypothetical protein